MKFKTHIINLYDGLMQGDNYALYDFNIEQQGRNSRRFNVSYKKVSGYGSTLTIEKVTESVYVGDNFILTPENGITNKSIHKLERRGK